jgi:hypothetical protein
MSAPPASVIVEDDPLATPEALVGAELGNYRVDALLSQGGMGAVYIGTHRLLGRRVAIKSLLPHVSADADAVRRFFNEARATSAISHPGIVQIYDFGRAPTGLAYIAMELLEGETLAARIKRGPASEADALALVRQVAAALAAAHAIGVVHRDLKPSNIFLAPDPEAPGQVRVKLLDFGIAKLMDGTAGKQLGAEQRTQTGAFLGTPAYMSPEQCRGVDVDHRTDIYALGCILYELLAGQRAFMGETAGDLIVAHIAQPAPLLKEVVPAATPGVATLVADLLRRAPGDRPQTCEALMTRLDELAAAGVRGVTVPVRVRAATPLPTPFEGATDRTEHVAPGRGRSRDVIALAATMPADEVTAPVRRAGGASRWWLLGAALTAAAAGGTAVWAMTRDPAPSPAPALAPVVSPLATPAVPSPEAARAVTATAPQPELPPAAGSGSSTPTVQPSGSGSASRVSTSGSTAKGRGDKRPTGSTKPAESSTSSTSSTSSRDKPPVVNENSGRPLPD